MPLENNTPAADAKPDTVPFEQFEKADTRSKNLEAKLRDTEVKQSEILKELEKYKGIDIEEYKAVKAERDRLEEEARKNNPEEMDKHWNKKLQKVTGELSEKISGFEKTLQEKDKIIKTLTVTDKVMSALAPRLRDDASKYAKLEVDAHCDLVDGRIVVKDEDGSVMMSKKNYREEMGVEEFCDYLAEKSPLLFKATAVGGAKESGTTSTNGNGRGGGTVPATLGELQRMPNGKEIFAKMTPEQKKAIGASIVLGQK